jgi:uncharacterized protein
LRRALVVAAIALAFAGVLSGCAIRISDTSFIRPVAASVIDASAAAMRLPTGYAVTTDFIATQDGEKLYRARLTHPDAKSVVVFFNGNVSTVEKHAIDTAVKLSKDWHPNLVFVDYRGYGQSSGKPSLETLHADALLLFEDEQKRASALRQKMVLAGYSIGGVVAGGVLETFQPDALLLIATVTDVKDMIAIAMPVYMKAFFRISVDPRLDAIDNRRALAKYTGPLLIVAAERDSQTPAVMSKALFDAAVTPTAAKQLVIAKGAEHNEVLDAPEFRDALKLFVAKNRL